MAAPIAPSTHIAPGRKHMKKLLVTIAAALLSGAALAQGQPASPAAAPQAAPSAAAPAAKPEAKPASKKTAKTKKAKSTRKPQGQTGAAAARPS
ncbi:MAG: hypothetical protein N2688_01540 [Burkholderiaceae bacterium]|nr:hypothetical protein [Burkholderiaceae bacterium]